jgi:carbonic anhydrase
MGQADCGAIKGAIDNVQLGNLTGLLAKIKHAVDATQYTAVARLEASATVFSVGPVCRYLYA